MRLLLAVGIGLAVLVSMDVFRSALSMRVSATSADDPALLGRLLLWRHAWLVLRENWLLGVGMQNFRYVKQLYGFPMPMALGRRYNAHNLYLEFLVDLGVFGFASFVWLELRTLLRLDGIWRSDKPASGLALALNAGLIAYAVHGLLDAVIWQHGAFMLLGVLFGLSMAVQRLARTGTGYDRCEGGIPA